MFKFDKPHTRSLRLKLRIPLTVANLLALNPRNEGSPAHAVMVFRRGRERTADHGDVVGFSFRTYEDRSAPCRWAASSVQGAYLRPEHTGIGREFIWNSIRGLTHWSLASGKPS